MKWLHRLEIADVFHDEARSFEERRDIVVQRILASAFWNKDDTELADVVEELADAPDVDEFDMTWDQFYNWCDENSVWVVTF